jgi:O-acetyl-ADP-ribose deacetylase (regulator of RNase III)
MILIKGDLLQTDDNIAHCVSEDFKMGLGIAKTITDKYGRDNLTKAKLYGIGHKKCNSKYILYIVTKKNYWNKPTLEDIDISLANLSMFCKKNDITTLSIPKIACGLDKLNWSDVEQLIVKHLSPHINITVYY